MEQIEDPVTIGVVGSPHGVRGTVRVKASGSGRHLREGVEPFVAGFRRRIKSSRSTPKGFLLDLEGLNSREEAALMRGEDLVVDRSDLDDLEEGEFYVADFPGMEAVDAEGKPIGEVIEVMESPAHEIIVVSSPEEEVYVPFTHEHVPEVDLAGRRLVVSPPRT